MKNTKILQGFTLIEMLIVMGIIILLMALGIGGGRLALQNAADTATQSAVKQIYEASQAYHAKNGKYPISNSTGVTSVSELLTGPLAGAIESFDGGSDTVYYYATDSNGEFVLVCGLLGGIDGERGAVCEGNGFDNSAVGMVVTKKKMEKVDPEFNNITGSGSQVARGAWVGKVWDETVLEKTVNPKFDGGPIRDGGPDGVRSL